ncbi:MAG: hypothetical protein L0332_06725 [Chloroflexi bacterium]|nr:hypothetical protein [Chloroflexota bacterium]MCI0575491.1 hypothetical protein [Chloroflexota bacterium]MCI0646673.1 hypothetical protein [Chloroflexota bacterium]MCI0726402.1 hypothetical protein [Chloroflexota bacterium]
MTIRTGGWRTTLPIKELEQLDELAEAIRQQVPAGAKVVEGPAAIQVSRFLFVAATVCALVAGWLLALSWLRAFFFSYYFLIAALLLLFKFWPESRLSTRAGKTTQTGDIVFTSFMFLLLFASNGSRFFSHPCGFVQRYWENSYCRRVFNADEITVFLPGETTILLQEGRAIHFLPFQGWPWERFGALRHDDSVDGLAVSLDGQTIASWSREKLYLWDVETRRLKDRVEVPLFFDTWGSFSSDGRYLATNEIEGVTIWDTESLLPVVGFGPMEAAAFAPNSRVMATAVGDGVVQVRQVADGVEVDSFTLPTIDGVTRLAFSPDGQFIAASTLSSGLYLWHSPTGALYSPSPADEDVYFETPPVFSPDGRLLAIGLRTTDGDEDFVHLWQITATGTELYRSTNLSGIGSPRSLAFSPDGRLLAVGTFDEVLVFDVSD